MEDFSALLPGIQKDIPLKDYTTYTIGGPAKYFFVAKTKEDVMTALAVAKDNNIAVFILGGGSNLLVGDEGFNGLVIKISIEEIAVAEKHTSVLEAGAGVSMKDLVDFSINHSLAGLEWAGGLPGTLGGAIRGNAGAFGGEMKDSVLEVQALNEDGKLLTLSGAECQFGYRSSVFKSKNWIVLSATLKMHSGEKESLQNTAQSHVQYRTERHPLEYPNSGSIFKNTPLSAFSEDWQKALAEHVKQDPFPVVPTAYLISQSEVKGVKIGNAQISEKHPNFIVNLGGATANDVMMLVDLVQKAVKEKFGVNLEMEVQYIGN